MLEYYVPSTITEHVYNINDTVTLNSRSDTLDVIGPGTNLDFKEFLGEIISTSPGAYTLTQIDPPPFTAKAPRQRFFDLRCQRRQMHRYLHGLHSP